MHYEFVRMSFTFDIHSTNKVKIYFQIIISTNILFLNQKFIIQLLDTVLFSIIDDDMNIYLL
jgi:predicted ribosome quality control (RQC) complex YloA/Tae2 family protein